MSFLVNPSPWLYLVSVQLKESADVAGFNRWYDEQHGPGLLSVPGINSMDRFQSMTEPNSYLTCYGINSEKVFDEPRYAEVRGLQGWEDQVEGFQRAVYRVGDGT